MAEEAGRMEMEILRRLWTDDSGQGLVEYGLLVGFVAVIVIALAALFGGGVRTVFDNLTAYLTTNGDPATITPP
jgi:pilus assembly protein Flp/PilA